MTPAELKAIFPLELRMTELCKTFPCARDKPWADPWNVELLLKWLDGPEPTHGSEAVARFILYVWNAYHGWNLDRLKYMDDASLAAWQAWAADPWWA